MLIFLNYLICALSFVRPYPFQRPSPGYDVLHYKIDIKVSPRIKKLSGSVEFTVLIKNSFLDYVKFNAQDLSIEKIETQGE